MSVELAYLGLAEAADLIRAKKLSPVEYTTALLAQIEKHEGEFNAFIAPQLECPHTTTSRTPSTPTAARYGLAAGSGRTAALLSNSVDMIETVQICNRQFVDAVNHRSVMRGDRVKPTAASGAAGRRAKFATKFVQAIR